jgi:tetratricopeptide (TPR) repeat protein
MRRTSLLSVVALLALALVGADAAARSSKRKEAAMARKHFKAGKKAYADGEYKKAAGEFAAGYLLDPKPAFLINIAQSHRQAGDLEASVRYYKEYLRAAPDTRLRPQVEGMINEIEAQIEEQKRAQKPPPTPGPFIPPAPEPEPPAPPPPPPKSKPFYKRWWFWAGVAAVVGAGVGVGIYAGTRGPDYVEEGGLGSVSW